MAEDSETKTPLKDPRAALAAIRRAQEKGILPNIKPPETTTPPRTKMFETKEKQAHVLESIPVETETIPPEIKKELTEKARRLNTIAMGGGEDPVEHVEAKGGAAIFKSIKKADEEVEAVKHPVRSMPTVPIPEPPPEIEAVIPSQDVAPAAAPWIKKEQPRMVGGTFKAAVQQVATEPRVTIPPPTTEQVAAKQAIAQGQEIKKRWYDRLPFLKILRGERKSAG